MTRHLLEEVSALLASHGAPFGPLTIALEGGDAELWEFLTSNALWGGAGSLADQGLNEIPTGRAKLEALLIRLGREQMRVGRTNVRTEMWVSAFEQWRAQGLR